MPPSDDGQSSDLQQFTLWAVSLLNLQCDFDGQRFYTLYPPGGDRSAFNGVSRLQFTFEENVNHNAVEHLTTGSPLFRWLLRQLRSRGAAPHLSPLHQPAGTTEIAAGLLPRYSLQGGRVKLGSCQIESRPILQLVSLAAQEDGERQLVTSYHDSDGRRVPPNLVQRLGLQKTSPKARWSSRFSDSEVETWKEHAIASCGGEPDDIVFASMIWCKFASGEIRFHAQGKSTTVEFADWAKLLIDPSYTTPPFVCGNCHRGGYDLVLTTDGHFTLDDAVETCPLSGARLFSTSLARCEFTGKRVSRKLLQQCPVTGSLVLKSEMKTCQATGLKVNPACLQSGCSTAASDPAPVDHQDARLSALLEKYPQLGRYSGWRLCETITRNVFVAGRLKQILLVVRPDTGDIEHAATGSRLLSRWREVPVSEVACSDPANSTPQANA